MRLHRILHMQGQAHSKCSVNVSCYCNPASISHSFIQKENTDAASKNPAGSPGNLNRRHSLVDHTSEQNKTRTGKDPGQFTSGFAVATAPTPKEKKKNPAELMRNRISSRSLILSFLVHLFYKKVGLDPYPNQFPGRFLRSTHNKSLIDGAQCSKFWFVIHAMADFKQRKYLIFNAFSSGLHFAMKALKIALWKNQ